MCMCLLPAGAVRKRNRTPPPHLCTASHVSLVRTCGVTSPSSAQSRKEWSYPGCKRSHIRSCAQGVTCVWALTESRPGGRRRSLVPR